MPEKNLVLALRLPKMRTFRGVVVVIALTLVVCTQLASAQIYLSLSGSVVWMVRAIVRPAPSCRLPSPVLEEWSSTIGTCQFIYTGSDTLVQSNMFYLVQKPSKIDSGTGLAPITTISLVIGNFAGTMPVSISLSSISESTWFLSALAPTSPAVELLLLHTVDNSTLPSHIPVFTPSSPVVNSKITETDTFQDHLRHERMENGANNVVVAEEGEIRAVKSSSALSRGQSIST